MKRAGVLRLVGVDIDPRWLTLDSSFGIARRPSPSCTCADVVGEQAYFDHGCEIHDARAGAARFVDARLARAGRADS